MAGSHEFPVLKRFKIQTEIDQGGMAIVYRAIQMDSSPPRQVALKVLRSDQIRDPSIVDRFLHREIKIIQSLKHENIVDVYWSGLDGEHYCLAMELLDGGTLEQRLRKGVIFPPEEAVRITIALASALAHAHDHGYVHRDVKPSNILFRSDNTPVLTDFGIVKPVDSDSEEDAIRSAVGVRIGTPAYMSPEQIFGSSDLDGRSDLYSLGLVLYRLLVGRELHFGSTNAKFSNEITQKRLSLPVPDLPRKIRHFQTIVNRLLDPDPKKRFSSAQRLIKALQSQTAKKRKLKRFGWKPAAGVAGLIAVTAISTSTYWEYRRNSLLAEISSTISAAQATEREYLEKKQHLEKSSSELKASLDRLRQEFSEQKSAQQAELISLETEVAGIKEQIRITNAQIQSASAANEPLRQLQNERDAAQDELNQLQASLADAQSSGSQTVERLTGEIHQLEVDITTAKEALVELGYSSPLSDLESQKASLNEKLSNLEQSIQAREHELETKTTQANTDLAALQEAIDSVNLHLKEIETELADLESVKHSSMTNLTERLDRGKAQLQAKQKAQSDLQAELAALQAESAVFDAEIDHAELVLDQVRSALDEKAVILDTELQTRRAQRDTLALTLNQQISLHEEQTARLRVAMSNFDNSTPDLQQAEALIGESSRLLADARELINLPKPGVGGDQIRASLATGNIEQALAQYQALLENSQNSTGPGDLHDQLPIAIIREATERGTSNLQSAMDLLEKGLQIFPEHPEITSKYAELENEWNTPETTATEIDRMHALAQEQIANSLFTVPKGNNALETYHMILKLDPNNAEAHAGIRKMPDHYLKLGRIRFREGDLDRAARLAQRGLQMRSDHQGLLNLRERIIAAKHASANTDTDTATDTGTEIDPCVLDRGSKACWCKTFSWFCE